MLKNYIKLAYRNLLKNKGFTFINIIGLAIGVTAFLLISLYVVDELSYDRFHKNAGRIYRINVAINFGGKYQELAVVSDPLGATLKRDYPIVENFVRFRGDGGKMIKRVGGSESFREQKVIYADSTLFEVFTFPLIAGNPKTALDLANDVVITRSAALKYFNKVDVVGEILMIDNKQPYKISGVIEDIPHNSHIDFDFFLSMEGLEESKMGSYLNHNFNTYLLLKEGADPKSLEKKFPELLERYISPQAKQITGLDYSEIEKRGDFLTYSLLPLKDIHLYSNRVAELTGNGNYQFVYIFSAIAFFVLLIACINFMNLSTARSSSRAKEVGVRKVLGSYKSSLIGQFLTESILISLIAFFIATVSTLFLLPVFNGLAGKEIEVGLTEILIAIPVLVLLTVITGLLAGSYPAFYLSSFQPISVLKGKIAAGMKSSWLRSGLVVFQFVLSTILIVGTLVIYNQLHYIRSKDVGYNKEQLLTIWNTYIIGEKDKVIAFKNEVLKLAGVKSGTMSTYLPIPSARADNTFFPEGSVGSQNAVSIQEWKVDHDYTETFGMKIVRGRNFSRQFSTDSSALIINETAAKLLGYEDPIGKVLSQPNTQQPGILDKYHIIGVMKDFHFESLRSNISGLCISLSPSTGAITFNINAANAGQTIDAIESVWKKMAPDQPFDYVFVDESFNKLYHTEQRTGRLLAIFAGFAIFIACLGLFGLVTYAAEQRTKEIGIRKVLGASLFNVLSLLSKDFLKLVIIAFVIAVPISWWAMNSWLNEFAYKIEIGWWLFAFAGAVAVLIALITISVQGIKAAVANPIKSLRTE